MVVVWGETRRKLVGGKGARFGVAMRILYLETVPFCRRCGGIGKLWRIFIPSERYWCTCLVILFGYLPRQHGYLLVLVNT